MSAKFDVDAETVSTRKSLDGLDYYEGTLRRDMRRDNIIRGALVRAHAAGRCEGMAALAKARHEALEEVIPVLHEWFANPNDERDVDVVIRALLEGT